MPKLEVFLSHRTTEARFADLIKERQEAGAEEAENVAPRASVGSY